MQATASSNKSKEGNDNGKDSYRQGACRNRSLFTVHAGVLYTSGQIAINPETSEVEAKDIEGQTHQICRNLGEVLKQAGTSFENVIKTTCFLADMGDFAKFNEVYGQYFTSKPARSCVAVKALPKGVLAEVEVIAKV